MNQQRSQKLEDRLASSAGLLCNCKCDKCLKCRQRQVSDREDAVKEQADNILGQQTTLRQLQAELLDQYNTVVASLPGLDDR